MNKFKNPVIEGFSPDPSICAVGEDFYLVTSTFSYFPGVPIYHSKDLVNWKQIGNILDRKSQVDFTGIEHSQGIFAPCIRYCDGIFYMITTNVPNGGNFIVTATNPAGPWSDPYFLKDAPGIDPSLFFDDDGKCYYVGTRPNPEGVRYNGDWEIWLQELDLEKMQLIGESVKLWKGAMEGVIWPEAPHLYKKDSYYYLMIAEGGTGFEHSVTIARSEQVTGPYKGNPCNPILTHRHLGRNYPVCNVGHGDLVETVNGEWYMVLLASRIFEGYSNLGRETFLAEVSWENGWPVVNPGVGKLLLEQEHKLALHVIEETQSTFEFKDQLDTSFLFLRNPNEEKYSLGAREGWLRLYASEQTLCDVSSPTYIGLRQQAMWYILETKMEFKPKENDEEAGLAIVQSDAYHIRFVYGVFNGKKELRVITCSNKTEKIEHALEIEEDCLYLRIQGEGQKLHFYYSMDGNDYIEMVKNVEGNILSTEVAGGFVGCTMGMYVTSQRAASANYADYGWLTLRKTPSI